MNRNALIFVAAVQLSVVSCSGELTALGGAKPAGPGSSVTPGGPGTPNGPGQNPPAPGKEPQVGANGFEFEADAQLAPRLRLKSNAELMTSVRETFGVSPSNPKILPTESVDKVTGFSNNSNAYRVGQETYLSLETLAGEVANGVAESALRERCTGGNASGLNCAKEMIKQRGRTLFAREVTTSEIDSLAKVFTAVSEKGQELEALRAVVEAMVQMPSFLYRTELGTVGQQAPNNPLTPYETAAALASFLWDGPPDAALLDAAAKGDLATPAGVASQAKRMVKDPKARAAFTRFAFQWLDIRDIESAPKDAKAYPTYSPAVVKSMIEETNQFVASTVFDKDSSLKTLLSAKTTHLDKTLSDFYGFGNVTQAAFKEVSLPEVKAGVLSQGAFMVAHSGEVENSPVLTGTFVRRRLLCNAIPPPPPTAPTKVDAPSMSQTIKDVYNQDQKTGCGGCHQLTNRIGFGLANLDAVGKTRTLYNNLPIDSSGEIVSITDGPSRPFSGNGGVYDALGTMPETSDCFVLRLYQFALGRAAGKQDKSTLDDLAKQFRSTSPRIDDVMVAIATSPAFLTRKTD